MVTDRRRFMQNSGRKKRKKETKMEGFRKKKTLRQEKETRFDLNGKKLITKKRMEI